MSDIKKLYNYALLSELSYILFEKLKGDFSADSIKQALLNENKDDFHGSLSLIQAVDFVEHWEVISHQGNTDSGFSATIFKNKQTGEYVYATRGTEPDSWWADLASADVGDIVTDGLAIKQIVDMYNDWQRLIAAKGAAYQVAKLDFLGEETALLLAARALTAPGFSSLYEQQLRTRTDIVIDDSLGKVYTISLDNWAHEVFAEEDKRIAA